MYQIGEYVVKCSNGICKIEDIMHLSMSGADKDKLYYLMIPNNNKSTKLYVPIDNGENELRYVLTEEQAWDVINKIPNIEHLWIVNEKQREQEYKKVIRSCNPEKLVGIIKTIYLRKQKRNEQGKKNTTVDEHYFKMAEDVLYSELAFALGREKNDICQLIKESIGGLQQNISDEASENNGEID